MFWRPEVWGQGVQRAGFWSLSPWLVDNHLLPVRSVISLCVSVCIQTSYERTTSHNGLGFTPTTSFSLTNLFKDLVTEYGYVLCYWGWLTTLLYEFQGKTIRPLTSFNIYQTLPSGAFPGGSYGKESACNAGDSGLIPGLGRFPRRRWVTDKARSWWACQVTRLLVYSVTGKVLDGSEQSNDMIW